MILNKNIKQRLMDIEKSLGKRFLKDKEEIISNLGKLLEDAVKKRAGGKIGIAFSGGVDSSLLALICSRLKKDFKLYSVGLEGSEDLDWATKIALRLKWPIKFEILSLSKAEQVIKKVIKILDSDNVVWAGVGSTVYSVLKLAKEDNVDVVLSGLGSEELFAGYEKHREALKKDNVHEECWKGLKEIWEKDILRDTLIANTLGVNVEFPFLDEELIKYSMRIDPKLKINHNTKKLILRECALSLGLKKEFAFRKKRAAQYGSRFDKAIEKLMKKDKFKYKKDYLRSLQLSK